MNLHKNREIKRIFCYLDKVNDDNVRGKPHVFEEKGLKF